MWSKHIFFLGIVVSFKLFCTAGHVRVPLKKMPIRQKDLSGALHPVTHHLSRDTSVALQQNLFSVNYAPITIGTPPQPFNVLIDMTESQLWVHSVLGDLNLLGQQYNATASSSYVPVGDPVQDGNGMHGIISSDVISVAGINIQNQSFIEAVSYTGSIVDGLALALFFFQIDGVFGLTTRGGNTVVQNMINQKLIDDPSVSLYFTKGDVEFGADSGEIFFGGSNPNKYTGNFTWVQNYSNKQTRTGHSWSTWLYGITVGNNLIFDTTTHFRAEFLTFFEGILGPKEETDRINELITGTNNSSIFGEYLVDCDKVPELPVVTISLGVYGHEFILEGKDYTRMTHMFGLEPICMSLFFGHDFMVNPKKEQDWYFGTSFLARYYTKLDYGKNRLGFANSVNP